MEVLGAAGRVRWQKGLWQAREHCTTQNRDKCRNTGPDGRQEQEQAHGFGRSTRPVQDVFGHDKMVVHRAVRLEAG